MNTKEELSALKVEAPNNKLTELTEEEPVQVSGDFEHNFSDWNTIEQLLRNKDIREALPLEHAGDLGDPIGYTPVPDT